MHALQMMFMFIKYYNNIYTVQCRIGLPRRGDQSHDCNVYNYYRCNDGRDVDVTRPRHENDNAAEKDKYNIHRV